MKKQFHENIQVMTLITNKFKMRKRRVVFKIFLLYCPLKSTLTYMNVSHI